VKSSEISNYLLLEKHFEQINSLNNILSIIGWDYATFMPPSSSSSRQNEITTLSSLVHTMSTSPKVAELISNAEQDKSSLDEWELANLKEIKRRYAHASLISTDLEQRHTKATNECEFVWREARKNNDFNLLKPYLKEVLTLTKEIAVVKADHFNLPLYDTLIDTYESGSSSENIKSVYSILKLELPTLIGKIQDKQSSETILPLTEKVDVNLQKTIGKKIMEMMGFDFKSGRLDESVHPFCGGTSSDIRMTTRYDENNFITGLMGVIHETGHGLYELNLPKKYQYQPVGRARNMAFHESQSLIMEMQAVRSFEFIEFLSSLLKDEFGFKGKEYSADNLFKIHTRVKPGFIRVDADEVTYPLHVILRFEMEEALINGKLEIDDLPEYWNVKMQQYLGITPETYSDGCLQDIHWPSGAFGYFPSYTNGAIIASMLMDNALKITPNMNEYLRKGNFDPLNQFLNKNLRQHASLKIAPDLLFSATGHREIRPDIFLKYLANKYL
jgi:carboxypeptidase Taq